MSNGTGPPGRVTTMLGAALLFLTTSPAAAAPALLNLAPSSKWVVDYGDWNCTLRRGLTDQKGNSFLFSLPREPVTARAYLRLTTRASPRKRDDGEATVTIDGVPQPSRSDYSIFDDGGGIRIRQFTFEGGGRELAAVKERLTFSTRKEGEIALMLDGLAGATRALETCMDELNKELGIDSASMAAMTRDVEGDWYDLVSTPSIDGFHFVTLYWVGTDGRVDDCQLLKPSVDKASNDRFCPDVKAKARFKPALDKMGKPMRRPVFNNVILRRQVFAG